MSNISGIGGINSGVDKFGRVRKNASKAPGINTSDSFTPGASFNKIDETLRRSADLMLKGNLTEKMQGPVWEFETGNEKAIASTPVLMDKENLVFRDHDSLYSINPETGKKNWELKTDNWSSDAPPKGKNNLIYTSTDIRGEGSFICGVDLKSGKKACKIPVNHELTNYSVGDDGNVYMGSNRKNLSAYDGQTGEKLWEAPNDKYVHVVGTNDRGLVIFNDYDKKTFALDTKTGKVKWEHEAKSITQVRQQICPNGDIAIKSYNGLSMIDGTTGKEIWKTEMPSITTGMVFDNDGNAYFATREDKGGAIRKISLQDGKELWKQETKEPVKSSPVLHEGKVFAGDDYGILYSVDSKSGKLNWKEKSGEYFMAASESIIPMKDGTIIVGNTHDGGGSKWSYNFSKIDMKDGKILKRYECPSKKYLSQPHINFDKSKYDFFGPVALAAPDKETGFLYVGTDDGKIVALSKPSDVAANALKDLESGNPEDRKTVEQGEKFVVIGGVKLDIRQYNFLYSFGL